MTVTPSDALNTALYKLTGYRLTQAAPHALTDTGVGVPWLRSYLYLADLLDGAPDGGAIVECGVATGGTLAMLVDLSQLRRVAMGRDGNVYGFDSWAGHMPSPTVADFDGSGDNKASWYEPPKGGKEAVLANLKNWGYESRHVTLVQGWFGDTMDQLSPTASRSCTSTLTSPRATARCSERQRPSLSLARSLHWMSTSAQRNGQGRAAPLTNGWPRTQRGTRSHSTPTASSTSHAGASWYPAMSLRMPANGRG